MEGLQRRDVPADMGRIKKPSEIVMEMVRAQRESSAVAAKNLSDLEKKMDEFACKIAFEVFRARFGADADSLVLALTNILTDAGVQIITYDGQMLTPEIQEKTEIVEWVQGNLPMETVGETLEPEIRRNGKMLRQAKLSCLKAAQGVSGADGASEEDIIPKEQGEQANATPLSEDAFKTADSSAKTQEQAAGQAAPRTGLMKKIGRLFAKVFKKGEAVNNEEVASDENQ